MPLRELLPIALRGAAIALGAGLAACAAPPGTRQRWERDHCSGDRAGARSLNAGERLLALRALRERIGPGLARTGRSRGRGRGTGEPILPRPDARRRLGPPLA